MVSLLGVEQETVGRKARFSGATGTLLVGHIDPDSLKLPSVAGAIALLSVCMSVSAAVIPRRGCP